MKINYERWRQQPTTAGRNSLKLTLYLNRIEMSKHKDLITFLEQSKGLVHKCISKTGLKYWVRLSLPALAPMAECHVSQPCPLLAVVAWWRTATFKPWENGKEVPRWGVAEIQKMSPSTTAAAVLSNKGVVQFWEM